MGTTDFEVYSDAYAALFDKIGPGVFITHSQGGPVGWNTLLKTRNIKAIASYEPGGNQWLGFLRCEPNIVIPYKDIRQIGPDIILVDINC